MEPVESVESRERPNRDGDPLATFVRYRAQQDAFRFLATVLADYRGIGLLHGPEPSGKTRLIRHFVRKLRTNAVVMMVDGARMRPPDFLNEVLKQLGDGHEPGAMEELYRSVCSTIVRQARSRQAPILVVDNFNQMYPSTLHVLCKLASLIIERRFALRIVLVGDQFYQRIIDARSMQPIAARLVGDFELEPLSEPETLPYLYARLRTFGVGQPDRIFVVDIATLLHSASGGWPANLDRIAESIVARADDVLVPLSAADRSEQAAVSPPPPEADSPVPVQAVPDTSTDEADRTSPKLIVTFDRNTVREFEMEGSRAIIGRSTLSDIVVTSGYVSRQHALLIRDQDGVVIIDLKSSNGTFVNSQRVASRVLRNNDIISIGNHRIKLVYPEINTDVDESGFAADDTTRMRTLDDLRTSRESSAPAGDDQQKSSA